MKSRLANVISALLLITAIALKAGEPAFIRQMEYRVFDLYQQAKPREYQDVPVRIVDIDDESLKQLGQWPWPRTLLATLVANLQKAGAAAIVFDIVFAEPDRTSPQEMLRLWDKKEGLAAALAGLPDPDMAFAETVKHSNTVTGFVLTEGAATAAPLSRAGMVVAGEDATGFVPMFKGAVLSLPALESAAKGNGALNSDPDTDGILRRVPMLFAYQNQLYPSLSMEAMRVAQGASSYTVKTVGANQEEGSGHGVTAIRIGEVTIPSDAQGGMWVYFTRSVPNRYVPAANIIRGNFEADKIAGNIVLIGTSAAGLKDIRTTPLDPAAAGVEVHAQAIEQALLNISLARPDWMKGAEICLMIGAALLMVMASRLFRPVYAAVLMVLLLGAAFAVSWYCFTQRGLLVAPIMSAIAVVIIYFFESLMRYMRTEQERAEIRNAFGYYMAPAMVEDLARHPEKLVLGGENRVLTVMFCDVRGFTQFSEQMNPMELTKLINRFLTPMTEVIMRKQGTIDKYIGDCIMAFWNAPLDDEKHVQHAGEAALEMMAALDALNAKRQMEAQWAGQGFLPLRIGIGLNTGLCCVGNMGSDQRFNFSALGDEVNLAARLEGQSKYYGMDIVFAESAAQALSHMAVLELDIIRVQGKKEPKRVYALLGDASVAARPAFQDLAALHAKLLIAYRQQRWEGALALLEETYAAAEGFRPDYFAVLYGLYRSRIAHLRDHPPASGWDAVHDAVSK